MRQWVGMPIYINMGYPTHWQQPATSGRMNISPGTMHRVHGVTNERMCFKRLFFPWLKGADNSFGKIIRLTLFSCGWIYFLLLFGHDQTQLLNTNRWK